MEARLNEAAVKALFSQEGPVGRDIERRAQGVVDVARASVRFIMHRAPGVADDVDFQMRTGPDGAEAVIGIRDAGSISDYLVEKENRESVWLVPALRDAFRD